MFLDQFLLLHDDGLEVDEARLARDVDLGRLGSACGRDEGRAERKAQHETREQCHDFPR